MAEVGFREVSFLVVVGYDIVLDFMLARFEVNVVAEHDDESTVSADFMALAEVVAGSELNADGLLPSPLVSNGKSCAIGGLGMRVAPSVIS